MSIYGGILQHLLSIPLPHILAPRDVFTSTLQQQEAWIRSNYSLRTNGRILKSLCASSSRLSSDSPIRTKISGSAWCHISLGKSIQQARYFSVVISQQTDSTS